MTHAQLAILAVNSTGHDILYSTCGDVSDMGARLVAGALADWFEAEADLHRRMWPEAARRAEDTAYELGLVAVYEDAETVDLHAEQLAAYEERGALSLARGDA